MSKDEKSRLVKKIEKTANKNISIRECCDAIGVSERSFYKWKSPLTDSTETKKKRKPPKNKLNRKETQEAIDLILKKEWSDYGLREIYYKLLDEKGKIIASPATLYRIAKKNFLLTKRSKTKTKKPLNRDKPILVANKKNDVWSWDVSQIRSDIRYQRFYLYVIIDIWSRFVVGWALENQEKTDCAINMWKKALEKECISGEHLVNHKDNGSIMTSNEMIKFVKDAKMVDSYSRAGVSDDNPYSESLFGTIKTFRTYPDTFESLETGREYFKKYFDEYNYTYKHSGIQFITPAERHFGEEMKILDFRNKIISKFYQEKHYRYTGKEHKVFKPILEVKIN